MSQYLGYARVSSSQQTLVQQHDAPAAAGVERVFADKMSETGNDRPGLHALMECARAGNSVTVVALDRLVRSLPGIIRTIEALQSAGVIHPQPP